MDAANLEDRNWSEILTEIRDSLETANPDLLCRFDELTELRGTLLDYVEAIEASLLGFDPKDEYGEAAFGDTTMLRTIHLLTSLFITPGRVDYYLTKEEGSLL